MPHDIALGIVGAAGRGRSYGAGCAATGRLRVRAVCDLDPAGVERAKAELGAERGFTDYGEMLERGGVDAVVIGTPMPLHVPQAIAALARGIHVLSEVPAGVAIDECRALVASATCSRAVYMMAENYTYLRSNQIVREMVRRGVFGDTYYAEGEYLHELKALNERTRWRRRWQTGVDGITYGTHSLGPILQWLPGDRVTSVCCAGSGRRHRDPRGDAYENEASCVMLAKTAKDALVKIRVDMLSDRPHAMASYALQGVDAAYESPRAPGERHRVWIRGRCRDADTWADLEDFADEFMPELWRIHAEAARRGGHGGGDVLELIDFAAAIDGERPCPIGIHEAMDMTLPGLISQASIAQRGAWLDVPDSRAWAREVAGEARASAR